MINVYVYLLHSQITFFFPLKKLIKVYPTFPSTDVSNKRVDNNVLSWARERGDPGREGTPVPQGTLALLY